MPLPNLVAPQAYASFDPITRRKVRFIETVVPTVNLGESAAGAAFAADRWYCKIGGLSSATLPGWLAVTGGAPTFKNWDTAETQFYLQCPASTSVLSDTGNVHRVIYPTGYFGAATVHEPKNTSVTKVRFRFKAKYEGASFGSTNGMGATTVGTFDATGHYMSLRRGATQWTIRTRDGTTASDTSGGTADGNWHEFEMAWVAGTITAYVDGVSTVTKTTNLPTEPLAALIKGDGQVLDVVDLGWSWE